jgi:chromosome segregation ATPase
MKHDVNFGLLGLLLLVIVAMIGLVIYYYTTYEKLKGKYDEALVNLENITVKVNRTQNDLAVRESLLKLREEVIQNYSRDLEILQQSKTSIGGQYNKLADKATDLEENLNSTAAERNKFAAQADRYYADSLEWKGKYDRTNSDLTAANSKITQKRGEAIALEEKMGQINAKLDELSAKVSNVNSLNTNIYNQANSSTIRGMSNDIKDAAAKMTEMTNAIDDMITQAYTLTSSLKG